MPPNVLSPFRSTRSCHSFFAALRLYDLLRHGVCEVVDAAGRRAGGAGRFCSCRSASEAGNGSENSGPGPVKCIGATGNQSTMNQEHTSTMKRLLIPLPVWLCGRWALDPASPLPRPAQSTNEVAKPSVNPTSSLSQRLTRWWIEDKCWRFGRGQNMRRRRL